MKNKIHSVLLIFTSILFCLFAIELIARFFVSLPNPFPAEPGSTVLDRRGFWTSYPGFESIYDNRIDFRNKHVSVGPDGQRNIPCASSSETASRRIFLLGDSQTFGWGLSDTETWANHLACRLNESKAGSYRVFNLGVPGTQVDQYWKRGIEQIAPVAGTGDIVVVSMTWNDLLTFPKRDDWVEKALQTADLTEIKGNDSLTVKSLKPAETLPLDPAASTSRKDMSFLPTAPLRYLNATTWRYRFYQRYGILIPSFDSNWAFFTSLSRISATVHVFLPKLRLLYYRIRPDDAFRNKIDPRAYDRNFLTVKSLEGIFRQRGARLIVQLLPNRLFFDEYYYESYAKGGTVFPQADFMGYVGAPRCASLGLRCVNRFADLATNRRDAHTFQFDGHFNEAGARRIGEALADDILDLAGDGG